MSDLNRCIFIGRTVHTPELSYTPSGTAISKFSLAINDTYGSGENKKESVCFLDCEIFGKGGEIFNQYVTAHGVRVGVSGKLKLDMWDDKDGNKKRKHKLLVDNFQFLQGKNESSTADKVEKSFSENPFSDSDVPF